MFIGKNRGNFFVKRIFLLMCLFLLVLNTLAFSQDIEKLNQLDGFKDFRLETNLKDYNNFNLTLTSDGDLVTNVYKVSNYSADLGPASVENLKLYFLSDKLMKIQMDVNENYFLGEKFHRFLTANFGTPNIKDDRGADPVVSNGSRRELIWATDQIKLVHYDHFFFSYDRTVQKSKSTLTFSLPNYEELHSQALETNNKSEFSDFKSSGDDPKSTISCEYETVNRSDGVKIKVFETLPVVIDQNTETALSLMTTQNQNYISINVRFREDGEKLDGNLSLRLQNNNMLQLPLVNGGLSYIGGSNLAQAIYELTEENSIKLRQSDLKTISYQFENKVVHTFEVIQNANVLSNQLRCL